MKTYGGVNLQIHALTTSDIVGGELSASRAGRYIPRGANLNSYWIGSWVGSIASGLELRPLGSPVTTPTTLSLYITSLRFCRIRCIPTYTVVVIPWSTRCTILYLPVSHISLSPLSTAVQSSCPSFLYIQTLDPVLQWSTYQQGFRSLYLNEAHRNTLRLGTMHWRLYGCDQQGKAVCPQCHSEWVHVCIPTTTVCKYRKSVP
jgi:hypothetical protein